MDNNELITTFSEERECEYKGRRYIVRDNGAIYRQRKEGGVKCKWDEEWTFGKFDAHTGYMLIGPERVHRIVCTAYHGKPEGDRNIVDHIDINRCNNRKENLRWVTRLENVILNPTTRAKIEMICGSIEAFLENPSLLNGHESENQNFKWMRSVTPDEAKATQQHWKEWAAKPLEDRKPKGLGVGEWIYKNDAPIDLSLHAKDSLTPGAKQFSREEHLSPTEFLLCPTDNQERTLQRYLENLIPDKPFSRTKYRDGDTVYKVRFNDKENIIVVITHNQNISDSGHGKPWSVWKISHLGDSFIHEFMGRWADENGSEREMVEAMGERWTGGEVFDDYF